MLDRFFDRHRIGSHWNGDKFGERHFFLLRSINEWDCNSIEIEWGRVQVDFGNELIKIHRNSTIRFNSVGWYFAVVAVILLLIYRRRLRGLRYSFRRDFY